MIFSNRTIAIFLVAFLLKALVAKAEPVINLNHVLEEKLAAIDALIAKKDFTAAIQVSLNSFSLNASNCRGIDTAPITAKDAQGAELRGHSYNEIVAQTRLDQLITLDPRGVVFKNARYLVSILAHEITHCDQNQQMYALAVSKDSMLVPLQGKVPFLRALADLDDVAHVAVNKEAPARAEAAKKLRDMTTKLGVTLTPEQVIALSVRVVNAVQIYKNTMNDLHEMEASLRAFELPGVIPPPSGKEAATEEFAFQYRFLMLSTNRLLRARQLYGAQGDTLCKMSNFVPFDMTLKQERNCTESVRFLQTYLAKVPG